MEYEQLPLPTFINPLIYVKQSSIPNAGLGVFASQYIPPNTKICDYVGEEMDLATFKLKYGQYKTNSFYTYSLKRVNKIIVAKELEYITSNPANYINELPEVNVILKKRALYTIIGIMLGEELSLQYPKQYTRHWLK